MKSKNNKKIVATLCAMGMMATMCGITASAASDGITVQMDSVASTVGYTVKGYYSSNDGNKIEVTGQKGADGKVFFPGKAGDSNYNNFYYEVFDRNGNKVKDITLAYVGNLAYADPEDVIELDIPITYDDIMLADVISTGGDVNAYLNGTINNNTTKPTTPSNDVTQPAEDNTTNNNPTNPVTPPANNTDNTQQETPVINSTSGLDVVVTGSNAEISPLLAKNGIIIYLTDSKGTASGYGLDYLQSSFNFMNDLEPDTYSVAYAPNSTAYTAVTGTDKITYTGSTAAKLEIEVTPATVLIVNNSNGRSDFEIKGVSASYATDNVNRIGVVAGESYTIVDKTHGMEFAITIPNGVAECSLDLAAYVGTTTNTPANEPATLDSTATVDNPYNIPVTSDMGTSLPASMGAVIPALMAVGAFLAKKNSK